MVIVNEANAFALTEPGGAWVDYTIVNPVTRKVESKTSYIEPVSAGLVPGCGVYKTAASGKRLHDRQGTANRGQARTSCGPARRFSGLGHCRAQLGGDKAEYRAGNDGEDRRQNRLDWGNSF